MAKDKNYYYVIVMTDKGAVFVTAILDHKVAEWDKRKKPISFSKSYAEDLAFGLTVNGYIAYAVSTRYEVKNQPYRYNEGNFYWRKKKVKNAENV